MKIDLRKDRGILDAKKFLASESPLEPEMSEDELLVETLKKRRLSQKSQANEKSDQPVDGSDKKTVPKSKKKKDSNRSLVREMFLLLTMVAVTAYYMHDKGILFTSIEIAKVYVLDFIGIDQSEPKDEDAEYYDEFFESQDEVLSEDVFNELMPVTPAIAALADSIAALDPDSLYPEPSEVYDSSVSITDSEVYEEYLPVSTEPIELSDDDISIINNRSLLIMLTEILQNYPSEHGEGHLFLKRDGLTISAPRGGEWVAEIKAVLDKFVLGSFKEDYSTGSANISSKFEIIMNAEEDFEAVILDEMKLLDVLAHPFTDFLKKIVIDLPRGVDDNPAELTFEGSSQIIQYILSSWAESRSNYLVRSIDIEFEGDKLILKFGVIFFNYTP